VAAEAARAAADAAAAAASAARLAASSQPDGEAEWVDSDE